MIPGFVVQGSTPATLLLRAVGPTLGTPSYNVPGVISDPMLALVPAGLFVAPGHNSHWPAAAASRTTSHGGTRQICSSANAANTVATSGAPVTPPVHTGR